ncbi:hypothetical protein LOD99_5129 [Oopsacas minuta]|uniref:Uncharacterized protein n=1 Tax=Oopsacas minuta TaxID=111878 RepID=A0AAV7JSY8_9METZ|nr:hypothetical protein LOD99_5129 [Oopsacas minuta]
MSKICQDLNCKFFEDFPDRKNFIISICPYCKGPLIDNKPQSVEEKTDLESEVEVPQPSFDTQEDDAIMVDSSIVNIHKTPTQRGSYISTDHVIVIFHSAILLSHFKEYSSSISLQFKRSFFGDNEKDSILQFPNFNLGNYEGSTYALFENSIKINLDILHSVHETKTMILPYKYFLNDQEEKFFSDKEVTYRTLLLNCYNFRLPNVIMKYDMIISPPNLHKDQQKDLQTLSRITFHLYTPVTTFLKVINYCLGLMQSKMT